MALVPTRGRPLRELAGKTLRLYHTTSFENATKIMNSGYFLLGIGGSYGGGIYFTDDPLKTLLKAQGKKEACLAANVTFKNPVLLNELWHGGNLQDLMRCGYDSIVSDYFHSGREYVVYSSSCISNIECIFGTQEFALSLSVPDFMKNSGNNGVLVPAAPTGSTGLVGPNKSVLICGRVFVLPTGQIACCMVLTA